MAINRFTKYTAPQFVQAYDPYPMQQMMGLAQHQQKRFDAIDSAIGKAYADAVIKPGLSVEGRRTAAAVNKERKQQLDAITNDFAQNRNVRNAVRSLSELSGNWQNDQRASFVEQDRALMENVLAQSGKEGYGEYMTHKALNPTTGEYTLGYTEEQIAAGVAPTLADYGIMSNPGSSSAFKTYIDPVKEVIFQNVSQDAEGNLITQDGKYLNSKVFLERAGADLNKLSSDGVHLDNVSDAPPETQQFIAWKKREYELNGKEYTADHFKADYLTEVEKYAFGPQIKTSIKDSSGSKSSAADNITPNVLANAVTTNTTARDRQINKDIAEDGTKAFLSNIGIQDYETTTTLTVDPTNEAAVAERDAALEKSVGEKVEKQMGSKYHYRRNKNTGKMEKQPKYSEAEIKSKKAEEIKKVKQGLDKLFYFRQKAIDKLTPKEFEMLQFNDDGTIDLKPEHKKTLEEKIANSFSVEGISFDAEGFTRVAKEAGVNWGELSEFLEIVKSPDALNKLGASGKGIKTLFNIGSKMAGGAESFLKGVSNISEDFIDNPIYKIENIIDEDMKNHYGDREFYNTKMYLKDKDAMGITTMVDPVHQELYSIAVANAEDVGRLSVAGKPIKRSDLEDAETTTEVEVDFRGDGAFFDPNAIEFDFVGDGYKIYATGLMKKKVKTDNGFSETHSQKEYQVDITDAFMQKMPQSELNQLLYQDAIIDIAYELTPDSGESVPVYLNQKMSKEAEEVLGGNAASISKRTVGNQDLFSISGKVAIYNEQGEPEIVDAETYVDKKGKMPFIDISQKEMLGISKEIAMALPFLKGDQVLNMTEAEQQAITEADIKPTEVESFDVGVFKLNTQKDSSPQKQAAIGFATNENEYVPVNQMTPEQQTNYASYLFVNGKDGWDQWNVAATADDGSFENAKFANAIGLLTDLNESGKEITAQTVYDKIKDSAPGASIQKVRSVMSEFSQPMLQTKAKSGYTQSSIAAETGLTDAMIAIATIMADSGFNTDAVTINRKSK